MKSGSWSSYVEAGALGDDYNDDNDPIEYVLDPNVADTRLSLLERLRNAAEDVLMAHAAYQSEAGLVMCECEVCQILRPAVEALG